MKRKNANSELEKLLKSFKQEPSKTWSNKFVEHLQEAVFQVGEPPSVHGPSGFPYLQLLLTADAEDGVRLYDILSDALDIGSGILFKAADGGELFLHYGPLWGLQEFGTLFDPIALSSEEAEAGEPQFLDEENYICEPSARYLPPYVRSVLSDYLRQAWGLEAPGCFLFASVSSSERQLVLSIFEEDYSAEDFSALLDAVYWFLPEGYSLATVPRDSYDRYFTPLAPQETCCDCGVPEGSVHEFGCDIEQCPLCSGQASSCGCPGEWLASQGIDAGRACLGDLSDEHFKQWSAFVESHGRLPFHVLLTPESEDLAARNELIALLLKTLETQVTGPPNPDILDYAPVNVPGFAQFSLRFYPPFEGRDPNTGERLSVPGRYIVRVTEESSLHELSAAVPGSKETASIAQAAAQALAQLKKGSPQAAVAGIGVLRLFEKNFVSPPVSRLRLSLYRDLVDELNEEAAGILGTIH